MNVTQPIRNRQSLEYFKAAKEQTNSLIILLFRLQSAISELHKMIKMKYFYALNYDNKKFLKYF